MPCARFRDALNLSVLLLSFGTARIAAQTLRGSVVEAETGTPFAFGAVQLLDGSGGIAASRVTNEAGRFVLGPVVPGSYRVRALRIGFRPWTSDPFTLATDVTRDTILRVPGDPILLDDIAVESNSPCRQSPDQDQRMALLWDEARTALAVAGAGSEDLAFSSMITRRLLDRGDRVSEELQWSDAGRGAWPITSQLPESLALLGFVQPRDTVHGPVYFGPDVQVFFSDAFLRTHCFRRVQAPANDPQALGLGFEPVKGRPVVDIAGVLWLDRSRGLRRLDYHYTGLWSWVPKGSAGGMLEFDQLGDGRPVLAGWRIRAPVAQSSPRPFGSSRRWDERTKPFFGGGVIALHGFREERGEVTEIRSAGGDIVWRRSPTPTTILPALAPPPPGSGPVPTDTALRHFKTWYQALPSRGGQVVWIQNISSDTISLTRVHVSRCLNIGVGCGTTELSLVLSPNDSLPALTIRPRLWDDRYGYQLSWEWTIRESASSQQPCSSCSEQGEVTEIPAADTDSEVSRSSP